MSRHSGSSKNKSSHRGMDGSSEEALEQCKSHVNLLNEIRSSQSYEWESYLVTARSVMDALDRIRFLRENHRLAEQVWLLNSLQDFAFHDPNGGIVHDLADWCQAGWLRVLRNHPDDVETLTGLGYNWWKRAKSIVDTISGEELHGSSSRSSSNTSDSPSGGSLDDDYADDDAASSPNDPRRQGPMYVEAQSFLQPAVEFYNSAVRSADSLHTTTPRLLADAAEAYISLGHVTGPPNDERNFSHAVRYLRRAEQLPGGTLSNDLQEFLDSYGRYVN